MSNKKSDVEECINMKDKVTQIAKDVLETKSINGGRKKNTICWMDEVKESVKEKSQTFWKWMRRHNLENLLEYETARKKTE